MQRTHINPPFEIHHLTDGCPIVGPAPAVEFRLSSAVEAQLRLIGLKFEQKPALLLTDAAIPHILPWKTIAQPAARRAQDFDVCAIQANFLFQFAK